MNKNRSLTNLREFIIDCLHTIHEELEGLNVKAGDLAKKISGNFRKLGR